MTLPSLIKLVAILRTVLLVCLVGLSGGCVGLHPFEHETVGPMRTQAGDLVYVYREPFGGREYSLDRGAKVFLNEGGPSRAPDRHTSWSQDK